MNINEDYIADEIEAGDIIAAIEPSQAAMADIYAQLNALQAEVSSLKKAKKSRKAKKVKIPVVKHGFAKLPEYATAGSAGCDVFANITTTLWIAPNEIKVIPTGLRVKVPEGHEIQVRSRSGWAAKKNVVVFNQPGTIDSDYGKLEEEQPRQEAEIGIILANFGTNRVEIARGQKIAQLVIAEVIQADFKEVLDEEMDKLHENSGRKGGFGSTGV